MIRDRLALVRARVAEATGQNAAALDAYGKLSEGAERPVSAAATLRGALLAPHHGQDRHRRRDRAAGAPRHVLARRLPGGGDQRGSRPALSRGRALAGGVHAVRRANMLAPNSPVSRALTADAQMAFEDLYLAGKGDSLSGVAAVALYFDFKELAPIGRRGDAVVRRPRRPARGPRPPRFRIGAAAVPSRQTASPGPPAPPWRPVLRRCC